MNGKPEENKIREAFEEVRLPEGAKERMYQNILKKAEDAKLQEASQGKEAEQPAQSTGQKASPAAGSKKSGRLSWRKYMSLAACLVIFIAAGIFLPEALEGGLTNPNAEITTPPANENSSSNDDIVLSTSPFEDVTSAEDFSETLGFSIDAPEGADDISYSVAFGETAIVVFTFDDHAYTYYASKTVQDISAGEDSENTLSRFWDSEGINYLLVNTDGADKTEFERVLAALQNS